MKISLNWLKDYISFGISPQELAHRLTMAGLEVEKISSFDQDTVFELEITPNRPDCLNILGIARETGALLNKKWSRPKVNKLSFPKEKCPIQILDKKGCAAYIGTVIKNVTVAPASEKIRKYLAAIGTRSINNVVDITNFCLMEMGQPLHAFDYDKLIGGKIVVRRAVKGEKIVTIDDVERTLDEDILVIADEKRPVAIAGIMGGKETEVTQSTKNILLESAYFDPILIRRACRKLGLMSDSSYRFERGVDLKTVEDGADRAISLILESAKGTMTSRNKISLAKQKVNPAISLSAETINAYLGSKLTAAQCKQILERLDFKVTTSAKGSMKITPPCFRRDILREVDVIEEIARIYGYDKIKETIPPIRMSGITANPKREWKNILNETLRAQGLNQVITYTMINRKALQKSKQENLEGVKIQNPLTQDQEMMRPSCLPGLLNITVSNLNHGQKNFKCFEIGEIYIPAGEKETLGVIMTGVSGADWRLPRREIDFYDLKGVIEKSLEKLGIGKFEAAAIDKSFLESGQSVCLQKDGKFLGIFGKIHEEVLSLWDIKQNIFFAQMDLETIYQYAAESVKYSPAVEYPAITRDVSLAVKEEVTFKEVEELAGKLGGELLLSVKFKEQYLGEKIPAGHRGLIFSLVYQSPQRTLREEEVTSVHESICKAFVEKFGAIKR